MCGIAGFLAPTGVRADRAMLERMVRTLAHRGPDTFGFHVDGPAALGIARLRVIDLVTADQPIANEAGAVHVALNGEIYGFAALRASLERAGHRFRTASDTEVIVHAWEEYGEHCPDHLNGMFGFAVWDRRREVLFLARDRMGEKPLYYAKVDGWFVFGSELRAVLAHPHVGRALDPEGLARYLAYDFVPNPHTIVRGVRKLPPGHALSAGDGKVRVERYWELPSRPDEGDEPTWRREIVRRLDEAVSLRLVSDVPLGCFLSGGIDSTAVAASAARLKPGLRTFSVGYAERSHDERGYARLAPERLRTLHEELLGSAAGRARGPRRLRSVCRHRRGGRRLHERRSHRAADPSLLQALHGGPESGQRRPREHGRGPGASRPVPRPHVRRVREPHPGGPATGGPHAAQAPAQVGAHRPPAARDPRARQAGGRGAVRGLVPWPARLDARRHPRAGPASGPGALRRARRAPARRRARGRAPRPRARALVALHVRALGRRAPRRRAAHVVGTHVSRWAEISANRQRRLVACQAASLVEGDKHMSTNSSSGPGPRVVGLSTAVVSVLESYARRLPIDFIARVLNVSSTEIDREVQTLEGRAVVSRLGEEVDLTDP